MATKDAVNAIPSGDTGKQMPQWSALALNDDGAPIAFELFADRSVQVEGTFGTSGTVVIEGSNDGVNYRTLKDYNGNNLSFTSADLRSIATLAKWVRPRVTNGDGTTNVTVTMLLRRPLS